MDIQTRKLNIISYLIGLNDEEIFLKIEELIRKSKPDKKKQFKPFTEKELIERAKKSDQDYLSGKYTDQEKLKTESKKW